MKLLITITCLFISLFSFSQVLTYSLDTIVTDSNNDVRFDIDNDGVFDVGFTMTYIIDAKFVHAFAVNDSVHLSNQTASGSPFLSYDSIGGISGTTLLCFGWSPVTQNQVPFHVGFYKKLTPTDSIFGYFTCILNTDPAEICRDTLFILEQQISTLPNTPLLAGEICSFDFDVDNSTTCSGSCDGSINVNIIGGIPPFNYSWSNGSNESEIDSLCVGIYSVEITDNNGCVFQDTIGVDSANTQLIMGVQSGMVWAWMYDGTGPYTYQWSGGSTSQYSASLSPGWHSVIVTDFYGCQYTDSLYIPSPFYTYGWASGSSCPDNICAGVLDIYSSGGIAPYYLSFPGSTIPNDTNNTGNFTLSNLCEGFYTYLIVDGNGDSVINTMHVQNFPLTLIIDSIAHPSCLTCNDGYISLTAQGGVAAYTYSIVNMDNGASFYTSTAGLLEIGQYTLCVMDGNGCEVCMDTTLIGNLGLIKDLNIESSVFPNPVLDILHIESLYEIENLSIYTLSGSSVGRYEKQGFNFNINLENLESGIYLLRLIGSNNQQIIKIVKE